VRGNGRERESVCARGETGRERSYPRTPWHRHEEAETRPRRTLEGGGAGAGLAAGANGSKRGGRLPGIFKGTVAHRSRPIRFPEIWPFLGGLSISKGITDLPLFRREKRVSSKKERERASLGEGKIDGLCSRNSEIVIGTLVSITQSFKETSFGQLRPCLIYYVFKKLVLKIVIP
jgi:hypothetical protein